SGYPTGYMRRQSLFYNLKGDYGRNHHRNYGRTIKSMRGSGRTLKKSRNPVKKEVLLDIWRTLLPMIPAAGTAHVFHTETIDRMRIFYGKKRQQIRLENVREGKPRSRYF
ncbi:MAG: hypothetical protein J5824_00890, partial [Lachnospiraceae bacterium]|nr:hypothetical protein [Lachnospiraceae bacterium]